MESTMRRLSVDSSRRAERNRIRTSLVATLAGLSLLVAARSSAAEELPAGCRGVDEQANEHTCHHGLFGPFASVGAQPSSGFVFSEVSPVHTHYTITLAGDPPSANESAVLYSAGQSGYYAFYTSSDYPLRLADSSGIALEPVLEDRTFGTCPELLTRIRVYALTVGPAYHVILGPSAETKVALVIEELSGFVQAFYSDVDGDGYGSEGMSSWCAEIPGFTLEGGDCDDGDPGTNPNAAESCNGKDDDCNGEADDDAMLCAKAPNGGACLVLADDARCGCETTADCAAGRHCAQSKHACEELAGAGGQASQADDGTAGAAEGPSGAGGQAGQRASMPSPSGGVGAAAVAGGDASGCAITSTATKTGLSSGAGVAMTMLFTVRWARRRNRSPKEPRRSKKRRSAARFLGMAFLFLFAFAALPAHAACGNAVFEIDLGEECDDGNAVSGDGCAECKVECGDTDDSSSTLACFYAMNGPFESASAQTYPGFVYSDLSNNAFKLTTLSLQGSVGANQSAVLWAPSQNGAYAFYTGDSGPVSLLDGGGVPVPVRNARVFTSCATGSHALVHVRIFSRLDPQQIYTLVLGARPVATVDVYWASLGAEQDLFADLDGDGWGGEHAVGSAFCTAHGYAAAGDCDDADAKTYPEAEELCDAHDNNCDGTADADEVALCANAPGGRVCQLTETVGSCGCETESDCATANPFCVHHHCGSGVGEGGAAGAVAEAGSAGVPPQGGNGGVPPQGGNSGVSPRGGGPGLPNESAAGENAVGASGSPPVDDPPLHAGAGGMGSTAPRSGSGGTAHDGNHSTASNPDDDGACGCRIVGERRGSSHGILLALLAVFGVGWRRNSAKRSRAH